MDAKITNVDLSRNVVLKELATAVISRGRVVKIWRTGSREVLYQTGLLACQIGTSSAMQLTEIDRPGHSV